MHAVHTSDSAVVLATGCHAARGGGARSARENEAASKCFSPQMAQLHFVFAQPKLSKSRIEVKRIQKQREEVDKNAPPPEPTAYENGQNAAVTG